MSTPKSPKRPFNPRVRANVYALAALYLVYLFYQIAKPYLTHDPYGPTAFQFAAGAAVLGGGAAVLGLLAWKMYKAPLPEEEESLLPEETGEDPEEHPEDD
jgi:hypothetical protein